MSVHTLIVLGDGNYYASPSIYFPSIHRRTCRVFMRVSEVDLPLLQKKLKENLPMKYVFFLFIIKKWILNKFTVVKVHSNMMMIFHIISWRHIPRLFKTDSHVSHHKSLLLLGIFILYWTIILKWIEWKIICIHVYILQKRTSRKNKFYSSLWSLSILRERS